MSIESILSGITGISDGGNNTAAEFRDVLNDMTTTLSADTVPTTDHIADGDIHFVQSAITITESQISDLRPFDTLDSVTSVGNTTTNNIQVGELSGDSMTFNTTSPSGVWQEGKIEWDNVNKTIKMYTDEPDVTQQMGQEMWMRVFNNTGNPLENGKVVTVVGVTAEGVPHVDLAIASIELSALNSVGFTTHTIEPGTYGYVTTRGFVNDVSTTGGTEGALIYLSPEFAGEITDVLPISPNWEVKVGGIAKSGTTDGIFYVEMLVLNNLNGLTKFYNGSVLEPSTIRVESNGAVITFTMDNVDAGNPLSLIFDSEFFVKNQPQSITLSEGTDQTPIPYYIYMPKSTKDLTVSTLGFPVSEQFIPVATLMVQSSVSVQANGVYKLQNWVDTLANENGVGQLTNINAFIRQSFPQYKSGNILTTIPAEDNSVPRIDLEYTNAVISQIKFNLVPGYDTAVGSTNSPIFVINDSSEPYKLIHGLTSADLQNDSTGASFGDKYYNVVIWGTVAEDFDDCKMFMNLPDSNYTQLAEAIADNNKTANYNIPRDYTGSAYLMTKFVLKNTGGNIEIAAGGIESLLGLIPSSAVGGGTTTGPIVTGVGADSIVTTGLIVEPSGILKGQVVYISGASGVLAEIGLADNTDFSKAQVLAVATESGANGETILITTAGSLIDFDTSTFSEGEVVYLGSGGTMTNIHPTGINAVERIGNIINSHATQGSILINLDALTVINNHNGTVRHQLVNQNTGNASAVSYTLVNDVGNRASFSLFGNSTFSPNAVTLYNEGHGLSAYNVDGNKPHIWLTDETDTHNFVSTIKMELTASGDLNVYSGDTTISSGNLTAETVITGGYTVATLPTGTVGMRAYVTDAVTPTYLGALSGGGTVVVPVFYNGVSWVSS